MSTVITTTMPLVPGYKIVKIVGIVVGMSVRTRGVGGRIIAGIESLIGGRGEAYIVELKKARSEALQDMIVEAIKRGANAVVGMDFETTELLEGFIAVTATGTAVVIEPESRT